MKSPLFYSLPPAGQKIPLSALISLVNSNSTGQGTKPEEHFKRYLGCKRIFYLSSGRTALWVVLKAFSKLKPDRDQVIIPAYSCPSIVSATLKAGLKPVLCDINLEDFGFLLVEFERKITSRTLAVIVVHLYGYPVRIGRIQEICKEKGAYLVEDAAQAFGNTFPDNPDVKLGLAGDAGFYSFGRGKPLNIMHGGLLAVKSEEVYGEAKKIYEGLNGCSAYQTINYCFSLGTYALFSNPYLYWLPKMIPFLDLGGTVFEPDFTTAKGLKPASSLAAVMLDKIEEEKDIRRFNSKWYSDSLRGVCVSEGTAVCEYPYLRYPLLIHDLKKRAKILDKLVSMGTGSTGSYPTPLNELPILKNVLADYTKYENAKIMSESIITLPVHSRVTADHRENIARIIRQGMNEN